MNLTHPAVGWQTGQKARPGRGALGLVSLVLIAGGCSQQLGPIFEEQYPDQAWPPAPSRARIRYVGQLTSSTDLKARPSFLKIIGDVLVGAAEPRRLYGPRSLITTHGGRRVWVADPGGRRLHLFDLQDRTYATFTRLGNSPLLSPVDVCAGPEDSIYVCDSEGAAIYRIGASDGVFLESLRLPEDVVRPVALAYDHRAGELLVVDAARHDIKVLGPHGGLRRIIGQRGEAPGEFNFPCDVVLDGDTLWVVDAGNHRVQGLSRDGRPLSTIGSAGDSPGDLALPKSVAVDSDGHVYVVDARFENIQIFDRSGRLLLFFGEEGSGPGQFWLPGGIFIGADDRIWICDSYNGRLQVFQYLKQADPAETGTPAGRRQPDDDR